jgi:hypothetical protein
MFRLKCPTFATLNKYHYIEQNYFIILLIRHAEGKNPDSELFWYNYNFPKKLQYNKNVLRNLIV